MADMTDLADQDARRAETVWRLTEHYVAQYRAGSNPDVSDYVARYPRYADEIVAFVAYYHALEVATFEDEEAEPEPPRSDHAAYAAPLAAAWDRITAQPRLDTLLMTSDGQRLSPEQLAGRLDLSADVVARLNSRELLAASIPGALHRRLARVLRQPLPAVRAYFDGYTTTGRYVAETSAAYEQRPVRTFRDTLKESTTLTPAQKRRWRATLAREGLS